MSLIVLDTCVIVDNFIRTRPRHAIARQLHNEIERLGIKILLPAFAMFEISHAIRQEMRKNSGKLVDPSLQATDNGLSFALVSVDQSFIERYLDQNLPELRAGDLVFAALAKGQGLPLITEDTELMSKGRASGIAVFSISEYLRLLQSAA